MSSQPFEFDGLVVEAQDGSRLLALPTSVLQILQHAAVIQFQAQGRVSRMRVSGFLDGRDNSIPQQAPAPVLNADPIPSTSVPTPEYGAPDLGLGNPFSTPPPGSGEGEGTPEDPANIPLRAHRDGRWVNIYVTRAQYEEYKAAGRIRPEVPQGPGSVRGVDGSTEGA